MRTAMLVFTIVIALAAARAVPAGATPTPVPDVKPDLSAMSMFLGTWNCKSVKSPDGRTNGHVFTTTATLALDGRWIETDQSTPPFDQYRTRDFVLKSWLTYDAATRTWVTLTVDNLGGYSVAMSGGWSGDTLVTNDRVQASGQPLGLDTVTRLSATHYHDRYEVKTPKGDQIFESDCTKGD